MLAATAKWPTAWYCTPTVTLTATQADEPGRQILEGRFPAQTAVEDVYFSSKIPDFNTVLGLSEAQLAQVKVEAVNLPRGLNLVQRDGSYFLEGTVPTPGLFTYTLKFIWPDASRTVTSEFKVIEQVPDLTESQEKFLNAPIANTPVTAESKAPAPAPSVSNQAPIILREIPDITVYSAGEEPLRRLYIDMDQYFRDPEEKALYYRVDKLPEGLTMLEVGPILYGRPVTPQTVTLTVTAHEYERDDVEGPALTISQTFNLHVLHVQARVIDAVSEYRVHGQPYNAMRGSPIHKDIFDIRPENDNQPEVIELFDPRFDRIYTGEMHVALEKAGNAEGSYRLYTYNQNTGSKGEQLAFINTVDQNPLSANDLAVIFEPHDLDSNFADVQVQAVIL